MLPTLRSTSSLGNGSSVGANNSRKTPFPHRFSREEVENNESTRLVLGVDTPSDGQYNTTSRKAFTRGNTCAGGATAAALDTGANKSSYAITMPPYMYLDGDTKPFQPGYNVSRAAKHATLPRRSSSSAGQTSNIGAHAPSGYTSESRSMLSKPPSEVYNELKNRPPAEVNRQNRIANNTANFVFSSVDGQVNPLAEKWKPGKPMSTSPARNHQGGTVEHREPSQTPNDVSPPASGVPGSTVRSDFCRWDNTEVQALRNEAAACRAKQQQTNYQLGIDTSVWASEARNYGSSAGGSRNSVLQAQQNRAMAKHQKLASQFTLGSSDMVDKDLPLVEHVSPDGKVEMRRQMASLKQLDFKPFTVDPTEFRTKSNKVAAQEDRFVLGHRGVPKIESVYRSSYTPTEYT